MLGDLDRGGGGGGPGWGWWGVKLVMRSLENRRHNGVMEGGSLSPSTPSLHSLERNKGAISIPYLMVGPPKNSIRKSKQKQSHREVSGGFLPG